MRNQSYFIIVFFIFSSSIKAQDSLRIVLPKLEFSGYLETYYSYDLGEPDNHTRPGFVYSHNKHNEVALNLGFAKVNYTKGNVHGNFALMTGTYGDYNLAAEQNLMKNVFEANVGIKISKKHNLWVDGGVLPSHIGFESAIGKDCYVLTRSILADNCLYYEAGVKISYTSKSEKWYLAAMYLNGWQRIKKIDGNQTPAFGTQLTYKPNAKITLNWSTYVGNEQPDNDRKWRYFNNLYALLNISPKVSINTGFDIGSQQSDYKSEKYDIWFSPVLILQYKPIPKIQLAVRGEYYEDGKGVIIATGTPNGFKTYGFSTNFDYVVASNVLFRIEARNLHSKDAIFIKDNLPSNQNLFLTTSLAISF
ncbi:MAG: porin [Bacteroidota bacterium]